MKKIFIAALVGSSTFLSQSQAADSPLALIQASIDELSARIGELTANRIEIQDILNLVWVSPGASVATVCLQPNKEFRQIFPDGTFANEAFVVPEGKIFAVTDVDVVISAGIGESFNVGSTVHAALMTEVNKNSSLVPHETSGVSVTIDELNTVSISSQLHTPALMGAGQQVCVRGDERTDIGYLTRDVNSASVRGYLVDETTQ